MKTIPLTKGQFAQVDDDDFDYLNQFKWHACWNKRAKSYYARRKVRIDGSQITILMHREVLGLGFGDRRLADHRDCNDTLNNQRSNLRVATHAQNAQNRIRRFSSTSGFKGVTQTSRNRWQALICVQGRSIDLGTYSSPEVAHQAYCRAATEHFGEFARFE